MKKIGFRPTFIKTRNVRNFTVLMDGLDMAAGEGRLGVVYSQAGRGKSRTSKWYASNNGCVWLRCLKIWRTSEIEFLRDLCREVGVRVPPHRKGDCFREIVERLVADPRPVFLDEIEKLPQLFVEVVRDLSDVSAAPFVLIGEEEILSYMRQNRRVWSRTFQALEFEPIQVADVILYVRETTGLTITPEIAGILHQASGGDWRIVKRDLLALVQAVNGQGTDQVTAEMARIACKTGLSGV